MDKGPPDSLAGKLVNFVTALFVYLFVETEQGQGWQTEFLIEIDLNFY
jgi:hypothetical protein